MLLNLQIKDIDVARNLDLTALRSFVAVADAGGVTRAASVLNLTQSAVSMQLKRLEESLATQLFDRRNRSVTLTIQGEQLLSTARRMLSLNDEVYRKFTSDECEGEIMLGVPHDVVYPVIPKVIQRFAALYPRMRVQLVSSFTSHLVQSFEKGELDLILTTEDTVGAHGETLAQIPLIWVGAPDGQAWRRRPLRLAYEQRCIFRGFVQKRLDEVGIPWEMAVDSDSTRTIEATVSADLAVHTMLEGTEPRYFERIAHHGALPSLRAMNINLYTSQVTDNPTVAEIAQFIREGYATLSAAAAA